MNYKNIFNNEARFDIDYIRSDNSKISYKLPFKVDIYLKNHFIVKLPITLYQERLLDLIKIFIIRAYNKKHLIEELKNDLVLHYMYQWVEHSSFVVEDIDRESKINLLLEIENRMNRIKNYIEKKFGKALKDEIEKTPNESSSIIKFFKQGYKLGTLVLVLLRDGYRLNDILDWDKNTLKNLPILKIMTYDNVIRDLKR